MNEKLIEAMKRNGVTQKMLASEIGIAHEMLNRRLRGKEEFRYWEVVLICRKLGIDNPLPVIESQKVSAMR